MKTTQLDNGTFNNYATEPQLYYAQYPDEAQQRTYILQGALASLFVMSLIFTSLIITSIA